MARQHQVVAHEHIIRARGPASFRTDLSTQRAVTMASPGFENDIKPMFRAKDRDSILSAFDLFDYDDVVERADAIVASLRSGGMPCDGAWPAEHVDKLQQWIDAGMPE